MFHEYSTRALVELMQIGNTPSGADPVLQHAPEAFKRIEVVTTVGWQEMQPKLLVPVGQRRRELFRPVDAATVGDHDHCFAGVAQEGHHWMDIVAQPLRLNMGDDLVEDFGGALLDRPYDTQQHPAGDPAPGAIADPRLAFERLCTADVTLAQGSGGQASALGFAPPACAGEGKPPEDGFIFIEQHDLPSAGAVLESRECERRPRERSGVRSEPARGPAGADGFFLTRHGRSRGSPARRSGGRAPWRVPDNSTGNGWSRAGAGRGRRGDRGDVPTRR